jgi:hypothetical protein
MEYLHNKHFSVAEALQTLYVNHSLIEKMQQLAKSLNRIGFDYLLGEYTEEGVAGGNNFLPREYEMLLQVLSNLDSSGIIVKGIEEGLVDFPHLRQDGEEVYLCYQVGEETIHFWHPLDTGYVGRKPLSEL